MRAAEYVSSGKKSASVVQIGILHAHATACQTKLRVARSAVRGILLETGTPGG